MRILKYDDGMKRHFAHFTHFPFKARVLYLCFDSSVQEALILNTSFNIQQKDNNTGRGNMNILILLKGVSNGNTHASVCHLLSKYSQVFYKCTIS